MIRRIALVIAVAIAALLGYAATRPDTFRVERSTVIQAPPDEVYALISDFHAWPAWSPWEKLDPAMARTHGGAASGVGATYAWQGNKDVGKGRMEIKQADAPRQLAIALDFLEPFEAHNTAEFTLTPEGGATRVNWAMHGPSPFISKLIGVFVSMDSMIGKDFEAGLAAMKAAAEK